MTEEVVHPEHHHVCTVRSNCGDSYCVMLIHAFNNFRLSYFVYRVAAANHGLNSLFLLERDADCF